MAYLETQIGSGSTPRPSLGWIALTLWAVCLWLGCAALISFP